MDTRVALTKGYKLKLRHTENGICTYTIQGELARGGASIVYNASYQNNSGIQKAVRMKECYPFSLNIFRKDDGELFPEPDSEAAFDESKRRMWQSFDIGNELFRTEGLTNYTSNTMDIYQQNGTVYIVTVYQEGEVLSYEGLSSLKDCVAVTKSIARVLEKIHNKGYLYLDMKPDNVFKLNGTTDIVQLFDFDSLIPISAFEDEYNQIYKISYTKGFSALELQMGNWKRIGKHSDVYSVGAILFYLLFGKSPEAPDSGMNAEYNFENFRYNMESFQDTLYEKLTEFFHNTLSNYYLDRYPDMNPVIRELELIENLADATIPFIQNNCLPCPKLLVGRTKELSIMEEWFVKSDARILFVTGMGGIGKSSLVRYYMNVHAQDFDTIVFLDYCRSLQETIVNDWQFAIHTVKRSKRESIDEYYIRKLAVAQTLTKGKQFVLVIDNFTGNDHDGMGLKGIRELIRTNWKILIITRSEQTAEGYDTLALGGMQKTEDACQIFESQLRRPVQDDEHEEIKEITSMVQGHTLVLELIAKQIANSFLTISQALKLIAVNGFTSIAPEQVTYSRDFSSITDNIRNIIDGIFSAVQVTEDQKSILKCIALSGTGGMNVNIFASIYGLENKDVLHEMAAEGWLVLENHRVLMHPVLIEAVNGWKTTDVFYRAVVHLMAEIRRNIEEIGRDNCEKRKANETNRAENVGEDTAGSREEYLRLGEAYLDGCRKDKRIFGQSEYKELLFAVIYHLPREREKYILDHTMELLADSGDLNANIIMKSYGLLVEIYEEHCQLDRVYEILMQAKQFVKDFTRKSPRKNVSNAALKNVFKMKNTKVNPCDLAYIKAEYTYLWVWYYDARLDGNYETSTKDDRKALAGLLETLDKAIRYMGKSKNPEAEERRAEYLRCKANILIRSEIGRKSYIKKLLDKAGLLIADMKQKNFELTGSYYLTYAWYYTYVEPNYLLAKQNIRKADEVSKNWCNNELDYIDSVILPAANIYVELGENEQAEALLQSGMELCQKKEEIAPYKRKEEQLRKYMEDVQ